MSMRINWRKRSCISLERLLLLMTSMVQSELASSLPWSKKFSSVRNFQRINSKAQSYHKASITLSKKKRLKKTMSQKNKFNSQFSMYKLSRLSPQVREYNNRLSEKFDRWADKSKSTQKLSLFARSVILSTELSSVMSISRATVMKGLEIKWKLKSLKLTATWP